MAPHTMQNPAFWKAFSSDVEKKKWKCSFSKDILYDRLEDDIKLYSNDSIFLERRKAAMRWINNDTLWITDVLGACKEIINNKAGKFLDQFERLRMTEPLKDFVEHIHYFYRVASVMESMGERVRVSAQDMSIIHDIDKLDPVMIVAYSERFEDNKNTSLWNLCMERHTHVNTHHQQHCLWHNCCHVPDSKSCNETMTVALREMVCDKVARRLQKNFNGVETKDMWDADCVFYKGLPEPWLQKALKLQSDMKHWHGNHSSCILS